MLGTLCSPRAVALAALITAASAGAASAQSSSAVCSPLNIQAFLEQEAASRNTIVDKEIFYREVRPFFSVYDRAGRHYAGTDAILDTWNADPGLQHEPWLAYILATAYHETAKRMAPIRETLASTDESAIRRLQNHYEKRGRTGPVYWNIIPETGKAYFGRGYVQLTWDYNYKEADTRLGRERRSESFYWNPDLTMEPEESIQITYDGMVYGWYTRHCMLRHMDPRRKPDFIEARRVINGKDKAGLIAGYAEDFLVAIEAATMDRGAPAAPDPAPEPQAPSQPEPTPETPTAPAHPETPSASSTPTYEEVQAHLRAILEREKEEEAEAKDDASEEEADEATAEERRVSFWRRFWNWLFS